MVRPLWKTVWKILKQLNLELPYDPAFPILSIYPKEMKTLTQKDICISMFIAAILPWPRYGSNLCPLIDEWVKKMLYI